MNVYFGFDALPRFRHAVATIGSFDGVHLGHQALLETLTREAAARGGESIVLTFEPHPRITLGRAEGLVLLTTFEEKTALLEAAGVDNVVVIPFDESFSRLSCNDFVRDYLQARLHVEALIVGYNHHFGHDRADFTTLEVEGLEVKKVDERRVTGEHVSSTIIRRLLANGETAEAERLLGHPLRIKLNH